MKTRALFVVGLIVGSLLMTNLLAYAGENAQDLIDRGAILNNEGKFQEAEETLRKALETLSPDDSIVDTVRYELGKSMLGQRRFDEALSFLKPYYEKHTDEPSAIYNYGLALLFTGNPQEAIGLFTQSAEKDPRLAPSALYYTGIAYLKLRKPEQAAAAFQMVVERAPQSAVAESARVLLAEMIALVRETIQDVEKRRQALAAAVPKRPTKEKPWSISASLAYEYDDNVALIPDSTVTLPEDISSMDAWRWVYSLGGAYEFYRNKDHRLGVNLGYTGTNHRHLQSFDVDTVSASLPWKYIIAPFQIRLTPYGSYTWVADDRYSWSYGLGPGISYQPTSWTWTDFDYSFGQSKYFRTSPTPEEDRDSDSHYFSLRQSFSFPDLLLKNYNSFFSLGLNYAFTNADGSSYDYDATGGTVLFQQGLPWDLTFLASFSYRDISYDNPNIRSAENEKRSDDEQTINIRLFKKIGDYLTAYAGYRYYDNNSNISDFFEYSSSVFSLGIRVDF